MAASDGDREGAFGEILAKNFVKCNILMLIFFSIFNRKRGGLEVGFAFEE